MTVQTKDVLKGYFNAGDIPSESNFADLIDTIGSLTVTVAANNASDFSKGKADYVCNASNDDVEIQAAIDALPSSGGKVNLSEGDFWISSPIEMDDFTTLQGQGFGTAINAMATLDDNMIELKDVNVEQVVLDYFRMNGAKANQSQGHAIYFNNTGGSWTVKEPNHYITNLMISYAKQCGVYIDSPENNASRIVDVFAFSCDGDGFHVNAPDVRLHGCDAGACGERGFWMKGGASMVSDCKGYFSGSVDVAKGQGFKVMGYGIQFTHSQGQDNYSHGFELGSDANRISLVGCQADSNGRDASRANGFQITGGTRYLLSGCSAMEITTGDEKGQDYGYQIDSGRDYIYIDSSFADGNIQGGLNNDSAGANIDTAGLKEW